MRTKTRKISGVVGVSLALLLAITVGSRVVRGQAEHVRWDIISLNFPPATPLTISAGGIASARANDGSQITLTGSGTFVAPGGPGRGTNGAVTGGGTWTLCGPPAPATPGCVAGVSGTYEVTGLVRWDPAPFPPGGPPPRTDLIDEGVSSTGLAVLSRSEEHTSELQSLRHLVCRLLLEKKKKTNKIIHGQSTYQNLIRQTRQSTCTSNIRRNTRSINVCQHK